MVNDSTEARSADPGIITTAAARPRPFNTRFPSFGAHHLRIALRPLIFGHVFVGFAVIVFVVEIAGGW